MRIESYTSTHVKDTIVYSTTSFNIIHRDILQQACEQFFEEYITLPDYLILSAIERIQLPYREWSTFLFNLSYPIPIHTWQEIGFPAVCGGVLCVGIEAQYCVQASITLSDTPLFLQETSTLQSSLDKSTFLLRQLAAKH